MAVASASPTAPTLSGARASVRDAAIAWMVTLCSGEASEADRARHRDWMDADPRHRQAWAEVERGMGAALAPVRGDAAARSAVLASPPRRRALSRALALAGVAVGAGWIARRQGTGDGWLADTRTGTAERRELALDDGTRLLLDAGSAVDVRFGAAERLVVLHGGALLASVRDDDPRDFVVRTAEGEVRTRAAQLMVRQEEAHSLAGVLTLAARVYTRDGREGAVAEGQTVRFGTGAIEMLPGAAVQWAAWQRGMLIADDLPLSDVIAQLRPYRAGFIRVSPRAASLRVLGAFALDDPERVLDSLAQTLPVRLVRYGDWFVSLTVRGEA